MWKEKLKPGVAIPIGRGEDNPIIEKMNSKSCITVGGVKWNASEIIGSEAAKLL